MKLFPELNHELKRSKIADRSSQSERLTHHPGVISRNETREVHARSTIAVPEVCFGEASFVLPNQNHT